MADEKRDALVDLRRAVGALVRLGAERDKVCELATLYAIDEALTQSGAHMSKAAAQLGFHRNTMTRLLDALGAPDLRAEVRARLRRERRARAARQRMGLVA